MNAEVVDGSENGGEIEMEDGASAVDWLSLSLLSDGLVPWQHVQCVQLQVFEACSDFARELESIVEDDVSVRASLADREE